MKKQEAYQISKSQLKTGIRKSLLGALELAGYAKDIVERGGNTVLALGLYSFAIEEYGKSVFFAELLEKDSNYYSVPKILFKGKTSHDLKFKKALSTLPSECTHYHVGKTVSIPYPKTKVEEMDIGARTEKMTITAWTSGTFSIGGFPTDFETRMSCFYLDWNETKNRWNNLPSVMTDELVKAIMIFEDHISKKLDLEYDVKGEK